MCLVDSVTHRSTVTLLWDNSVNRWETMKLSLKFPILVVIGKKNSKMLLRLPSMIETKIERCSLNQ